MEQATDVTPAPAAPQPSHRKRNLIAAVAAAVVIAGAGIGIGLALSGGSSPSTTAAAATGTTPASSPTTADASDASTPLANCSSADNGVRIGFEAWETLMKSDDSFTAWVKDTASLQSGASSAQSFDSTFGLPDNASAAGAFAFALRVVESDLQQGVQSGEAPSSYKDDVEAAIAAEAPFESCASAP